MTIRVVKIEADVVKTNQDASPAPKTSAPAPNKLYSKAVSDPYRTLVSNNQRAETAPLEEMIQAAERITPRSQRRSDVIQALIGSLMGDDGSTPTPSKRDFPLPHVPSLHGEILKDNPELRLRLEPVIGDYEASEAKIKQLIKVSNKSLKSGRLTSSEILAVAGHKKDLERLLNKCRDELDKANAMQRLELEERRIAAYEAKIERYDDLGLEEQKRKAYEAEKIRREKLGHTPPEEPA